jgi:hypothetical protein
MIPAITVTAPSGQLSNALLHIVQGLERLGVDVLTDLEFQPGRTDGVGNSGGFNIYPPYSLLTPTRFRKSSDLGHGPLFVDLTFGNPKDWGMVAAEMAKRPVILFNMNDNCTLASYPDTWIVFTANHSHHASMSGRHFPFQLGVSQDLLTLIEQQQLATRPRDGSVLRNFRPSWNQNVRDMLDLAMVPALTRHFHVRRSLGGSLEQYLDGMSAASAVLAYGGQLVFDYFKDDAPAQSVHCKFPRFKGPVEVMRWDGWRFYEACAFGCAPLQLDFTKYGFSLPAPPKAWQEYIPVDLEEISFLPQKLALEVRADPQFFARIGAGARQWLLREAAPEATARHVLATLARVADEAAVRHGANA